MAELDAEKRRQRIERVSSVREVVFGVQDGILTTAGILCSLSGAVSNRVQITLSVLAATAAGSLSMGAGAYLGGTAEKDAVQGEIARANQEVSEEPYVVQESLLDELAKEGLDREAGYRVVKLLSSSPEALTATVREKLFGISGALASRPLLDGAVMGAAYLVGSMLPLVPYLAIGSGYVGLEIAIATTAIALFGVGYLSGRLAERKPILSGLRFLSVAVGAAVAGYVLGIAIARIGGFNSLSTA